MAGIFKHGGPGGGHAGRMTTTPPAPAVPAVPQTELDDLRRRLDSTRWPAVLDESAAVHGISVATVRRLAERWRTGFDWRAVEAELDRLGQVLLTTPDGRRLHVLHARSAAPGRVPVLLVHGWPDSLLRFTRLVPLLRAAGHDVVVPAIPGFGFSDQPRDEMSPGLVAEDFAWLMGALGYRRYAVHGGDWGSAVATALAEAHADAVVALHLTDVPWDKTFSVERQQASPAEQTFLAAAVSWAEGQTYLTANTRNPDTVAVALTDSPAGLLAWIAEMYQEWSDEPVPDDDVLALASLLWLTNTVRSSMRLYSEPAGSWDADDSWAAEDDATTEDRDPSGWSTGPVEVPTAFALFPRDLAGVPPREFAERFFPVERFTVMPRGGHFAALEQPALLAEDLVAFLLDR
jgi:pimeloyl-ACP methyl ester carboxylesterase